MHTESLDHLTHSHAFLGEQHEEHERRTWLVVGLTFSMMVAEITGGTLFGSLALVADGWHLSTHAAALTISAAAYHYARRHAANPGFTFGTGKLGDPAGYTSAVVLGMIALLIAYQRIERKTAGCSPTAPQAGALSAGLIDRQRAALTDPQLIAAVLDREPVRSTLHIILEAPKLVRRFQNNGPMASCCIIDFVAPSVDDGLAIDVGNKGHRRSPSSCLELTRMWRSTERASLEKKPSMRLSHDPCVGVNVKVKRPTGCAASQLVVSRETWAEWLSRMISIAVSAG